MRDAYQLPGELSRHAFGEKFAPEDLRLACQEAGKGLGHADAREARFRPAAEMVALWRGLDLPAWEAPYVLRDARLGYINGYEARLGLRRTVPERNFPCRRGALGRGLAKTARIRPEAFRGSDWLLC